MLKSIYIKNFILIDELHLDVGGGLTVLTGETGAGKSILLGALNAGLGKRLSAKGVLRNEEEKAVVEIVMDIDKGLRHAFEELEVDFDTRSTFRREILPSGKTRCFVNDTPTKSAALQELTAHLVDINSQKDEGLIHRPIEQLSLIDTFVPFNGEKREYEEKYIEFRRVDLSIKELENVGPSEDLDYLKFVFEELNRNPITEAEYLTLEQDILEAKSIREEQSTFEKASTIVSNENGLLDQLYSLESILLNCSEEGVLSSQIEIVRNSISELKGVERIIYSGLNGAVSEQEYNLLLEKKTLIDDLIRKHRVLTVEALENKRGVIRNRIAVLENKDQELARLHESKAKLEQELNILAEQMQKLRLGASKHIEYSLNEYLDRVDLPKARLELAWKKGSLGAHGLYSPDLQFSANPGSKMQSLSKVASGGEQSRVKLALKAVLGQDSGLSTQIFDEIDTGISGSTAEKVGLLMREMSVNQQIITITHLPQVASKGDSHLLVSKSQESNSTSSNVVPLTQNEREKEIARMISGEHISVAAMNQAKTLLKAE